MGTLSLIVIGFTLLCVVIDGFLGLLRGRNRAILRLVLVLVSAVLAVLLLDAVVSMVLNINVGDGVPLKESIFSSDGGEPMPEELQNVVFTLIEIVVGIVVYFLIFFVLKLITWMILFPVFKAFIKQGDNKGPLLGFIVGALQGIVVAFLICAPLTGLVGDLNNLSNVEIDGQPIIPINDTIGLNEFTDSGIYKVYNSTGGWYYEMVSSSELKNGTKVSLSDSIGIVVAVTEIASTAASMEEGLENMVKEDATPQERINGLASVGESLIAIDDSINSLGEGGKAMFDELLSSIIDMAVTEGDEGADEMGQFLGNLNTENLSLKGTGEALVGISTYIQKTTEGFAAYGETIYQDEVSSIVNGLAENTFFLDLIANSEGDVPVVIDVSEYNEYMFENAIENTDLTAQEKDTIRQMFGITAFA
ncbi:MAG: hypothetical protein IJA97_02705 [Clostridia bacterium]|nr:hypothetical protein [Clostridia bacterium]